MLFCTITESIIRILSNTFNHNLIKQGNFQLVQEKNTLHEKESTMRAGRHLDNQYH